MIKVGIVGAGGYAGVTLISLLLRHPEVKIVWLISEEAHKGKKIAELYPHLLGELDMTIQTLNDLEKVTKQIDLVFLALPYGIAMDYVPGLLDARKKVIDLGADFRFNDTAVFKFWYGSEHKAKTLAKEAVFGLPEYFRREIKKARLIGNPGCYPTASILALAPLAKAGLIDTENIIVDAKSGISGAGRGLSLKIHFCERNDGFEAYAVTNHRHMGEIEYQVARLANDSKTRVTFVPHLVPMDRGILATVYVRPKGVSARRAAHPKLKDLQQLYKTYYRNEPFVRLRESVLPCTKHVVGTNYCDIAVQVNERTGQIIILSAIDNLVKGAAGQAVQNMNIMYGIKEITGLRAITLFP